VQEIHLTGALQVPAPSGHIVAESVGSVFVARLVGLSGGKGFPSGGAGFVHGYLLLMIVV
jgi:hypothetical protein